MLMCVYDFHGAMIKKAVSLVKSNCRKVFGIWHAEIAENIVWSGKKLLVTFHRVQKCYTKAGQQDTLDDERLCHDNRRNSD